MGSSSLAKALLFDTTRCIGCGACYRACKERNGLPATGDVSTDVLSDRTYTTVEPRAGRYVRRMCMHCASPTCVASCPVAALAKTPSGPVVYDEKRCIGCRYCIQACPFSIPRYEWGQVLPRVRKCDMCADRLAAGLPTACASVCPTGATCYGSREELLRDASERLRLEPARYVQHVYGEHEAGGTSVLLISDVPLGRLGYPEDLGSEPMPIRTWQVLSQVPRFSVAASIGLAGLWWITKRRTELARGGEEER